MLIGTRATTSNVCYESLKKAHLMDYSILYKGTRYKKLNQHCTLIFVYCLLTIWVVFNVLDFKSSKSFCVELLS